jgi:hypothetical protein
MSKVAVVTGSSGSIGYETSLFFGKEPICNLWKRKVSGVNDL